MCLIERLHCWWGCALRDGGGLAPRLVRTARNREESDASDHCESPGLDLSHSLEPHNAAFTSRRLLRRRAQRAFAVALKGVQRRWLP
jgi:hypothetical protein